MKRDRQGFTLVELLVVIGIIAVLMSILLSVISNARQLAQRAVCQQNMKNLVTAVFGYSSDNDGWLPYCNWNDDLDASKTQPACYGAGWLYSNLAVRKGNSEPVVAGSWDGLSMPPIDGVKSGVLYSYVNNVSMYHCPQDDPQAWSGSESLSSYVMNGAEWCYRPTQTANSIQAGFYSGVDAGSPVPANPGCQVGQFKNTQACALLIERMNNSLLAANKATVTPHSPPAGTPAEYTLTTRHLKGGNVAFMDGHIEFWLPTDYNTWLAGVVPGVSNGAQVSGALWCNPLNTSTGR